MGVIRNNRPNVTDASFKPEWSIDQDDRKEGTDRRTPGPSRRLRSHRASPPSGPAAWGLCPTTHERTPQPSNGRRVKLNSRTASTQSGRNPVFRAIADETASVLNNNEHDRQAPSVRLTSSSSPRLFLSFQSMPVQGAVGTSIDAGCSVPSASSATHRRCCCCCCSPRPGALLGGTAPSQNHFPPANRLHRGGASFQHHSAPPALRRTSWVREQQPPAGASADALVGRRGADGGIQLGGRW